MEIRIIDKSDIHKKASRNGLTSSYLLVDEDEWQVYHWTDKVDFTHRTRSCTTSELNRDIKFALDKKALGEDFTITVDDF